MYSITHIYVILGHVGDLKVLLKFEPEKFGVAISDSNETTYVFLRNYEYLWVDQ